MKSRQDCLCLGLTCLVSDPIYFSGCVVLQVLPENIGCLPKLQHLNVSQNQLSHLPASLCRASALLELHAGFNQLEDLPCEFGMLAQLRLLNVCNNQLTVSSGLRHGPERGGRVDYDTYAFCSCIIRTLL
jgi:Leucine-rich repeat (LRR) protein